MTTPVQSNDPLLSDIQGNILKGHGRNFASHIFLQFLPGKVDAAKDWIADYAEAAVTSMSDQLQDTAKFKKGQSTGATSVVTLSLSASGFDKLGLSSKKPGDTSFQAGMRSRAAFLKDDPAQMEASFNGIDMMIMVADDDEGVIRNKVGYIVQQTGSFAHILVEQKGNVLKMSSGIGIEHFGYADGISQPLYLADDINGQHSTTEWNDATDIARLLVKENHEDGKEHFGSYLVFRKLEQNVKGFKDDEGDNAIAPPDPGAPGVAGVVPLIKDVDGNPDKDLGGAMLVGRFENSTPVVQSSNARVDNPPVLTNDFNYGNDLAATKCPFHAHIRLMNPRDGDPAGGDVAIRRITRRGIPYDEIGRMPKDKINAITDDMLDENQPTGGVGLLFMCYQNSISGQFEILQGVWANTGQIGGHAIGMQDSVITQGTNPPKTLPAQWSQPGLTAPFTFGKFVTMKGGEYLYTPSLSLLKGL